ncbi:hypothetical protein [uncultured Pseudomonas sp.]|uniref:hypothetical protein n=1 Tax=uncultured Pseudomonas sp. TaxID=114707 RepID=UPI001D898B29|nr:hypothetical protein [uncultured Pseudomonas sp.]MBU1833018.1 hypothetical protein [Gammaproteobacteria bacterium]
MKKSVVISIVAAAIMFFALCFLFSGTPDNAGLIASLDPLNAVNGLSFALSFGAGLPSKAAVIAAIVVFTVVPFTVFLVARHFLRRYDS